MKTLLIAALLLASPSAYAGAGDKIDAEFYHCAKAVDANHKLCLTSAKTDSDGADVYDGRQ